MSKSVFPPIQQTPLFAIRSCIADKANTVNRAEFDALSATVQVAKTKCNELVQTTNEVIQTTNLFAIIFDKLFSAVYPTGTVYYSTMPPEEFMMYQQGFGVWGYFSGNWGYSTTPVQEIEFCWFDPIDPNTTTPPTFEELQNRTEAEPQSTPGTEPDGTGEDGTAETGGADGSTKQTSSSGMKHTKKFQIYAYWCQKEEEVNYDIPEDRPELKPVE